MKFLTEAELSSVIPKAYKIEKYENITCINSTAAILRHIKSGAHLAVFVNDDENKLFSAAFKTPPKDDCGTPHIIEHSVLCGSERYPIKDPFMQLVKTSMQTFLNAMTYADKTVYPVSSCNDADFINLSNVYLDAVFAPNIAHRREIFMQEGWHYEPTEDGGIGIGGVVYSEMMGAVSSPDSNVYDGLICSLFPDNAYGRNSGGDPDHIPTLTYEKFLDFYKSHYHPSNCYITLYGNMDIRERLEYIDLEYLSKYTAVTPDTDISDQEPFGKGILRRVTKKYPIAPDESPDGKTFLAYGAVCTDSTDVIECMALDFLSDILVESPGAPVKSALISAGIGQEVYGGFLNHMKRPVFSVIAKNTDESDSERFMQIITDTLTNVAKEGVSRKSLIAAIERSEFRFREGEQGGTSRGLNVALSMLQNWIYSDDCDPFAYLRADEILAEMRRLCDTDYYEKLVLKLIDSDHTALFTLAPEAGMNEGKAAELKEKLSVYRRSLSDSEYERLCEDFESFTAYQDKDESEEELACIPLLSKENIAKDPSPLFIREGEIDGVPAILHDIPTNGIAYVRFMFDISHIPNEDLPYLDILSSVLGKTDTASHKYEDLLDEIRLNTGGFGFACEVYRRAGGNGFRPMYEINLRVLTPKLRAATALAEEIITETNLSDRKRIREILSELVSEKQGDIISAGSEYATARALAYFSAADAFEDYLDGITSYMLERKIFENFDARADEISEKLQKLVLSIFTKRNCMMSITTDEENFSDVMNTAASFAATLPVGEETVSVPRLPLCKLNEGFLTTSKVQYAAIAGNMYASGHPYRGEYQILASVLKNDYLYPEIRMKGGAYGYSCAFSVNSGNVCMSTYRDPCLAESLDVFRKSGDFVRSIDLSKSELTGHIIGTFGKLDRPMSAYMKASRSLAAYMSGRTYEDIRRDRLAMLDVEGETLRSFGDFIDSVLSQNYICVIGNEEKILENKHLFENIVRLS